MSTCTALQAEGGVTVAAIESSRNRRTLLACALGSMLPALCLGQTAGMPPLPPLAGTAPLAAAPGPSDFTFVVAGDDRPATETATPTATIVEIFAEVVKLKPAFMLMLGEPGYGKAEKDK